MSTLEVTPGSVELLDSVKPYGAHLSYSSSLAGAFNPWKFSVAELYGCVCHRPWDEPAASPNGSDPDSGIAGC